MSLLMQALKKAEHAKKQSDPANPNTQAEQTVASSLPEYPTLDASHIDETPSMEILPKTEEVKAEELKTVEVRIEPKMDMAMEAAPVTAESPPHPTPPLAEPVPTPTPAAPEPSPEPTPTPAAGNVANTPKMAQSVFNAKQGRQNSRVIVLASIAGFILFAAGAGYTYWQMNLQPDSFDLVGAAHNNPPVHRVTPLTPNTKAADTSHIEGASNSPGTDDLVKNTATGSSGISEQKARHDETKLDMPPAEPDPNDVLDTAKQIRVKKGVESASTNSTLNQAYQMFMAGQLDASLAAYQAVLKNDGNNRDALLGVAAIKLKQRQPDAAAALYSKLLDLNPNDPDAISGLISLRQGNSEQSESQLKKVLAQNPHSGATLFELGNVYMQQSRWAEAEDVYFRAFETEPNNADYAFNLAISLDRLGQQKLALNYYQRALNLNQQSRGNFDPSAAQNRIQDLEQSAATQ